MLLFGAGIKRGAVAGRTDARGEEPDGFAVSPSDLYATTLTALGLDLDTTLTTSDRRPIRIVEEDAQPVKQVLA